MTPEGLLQVEVPRIALSFKTHFGRLRRDHPATLTSLLAEPEQRRLSLVWQGSLEVPAPQTDYLDETEVVEL